MVGKVQKTLHRQGLVCAVSFFLTACLSFGWHSVRVSVAPNGSSTVDVVRRCVGPDCIVRVWLQDRSKRVLLFDDRRDRLPRSAVIGWSADSSRVGIHVCDPLGGNITIGYSLVQQSAIPGESVLPMLNSEISKRYHPTADPLEWACSPAGISADNP
jgi:hypothetical protein